MIAGPQLPQPTWFIGCGNMGGAILDGWKAANVSLSGVTVIRPSGAAIDGVRVVKTLAEAGPPPKLVMLAFKPQKLDEIAPQLRPWLTAKSVVVSILAGVEAASLRQRFPGVAAIVRAMPNLPVAIRRGVVGLYSPDADDKVGKQLAELFVALGFAAWMKDEEKLAALGDVAGAGPAYVARFIAALTSAGERNGLSREIASTVALETVLGTAWMAAATKESMEEIVRRVASPQGTTQAGLAVLDGDSGLDQLIRKTLDAAARREAELAEAARSASLAEGASLH